MGIEHAPQDPLDTLLEDLQSNIESLGFSIEIIDEEELSQIRSDGQLANGEMMVAVESDQRFTPANIMSVSNLLTQLETSLYTLEPTVGAGQKFGYITIKPKVN